jgi:hypothetical protein
MLKSNGFLPPRLSFSTAITQLLCCQYLCSLYANRSIVPKVQHQTVMTTETKAGGPSGTNGVCSKR